MHLLASGLHIYDLFIPLKLTPTKPSPYFPYLGISSCSFPFPFLYKLLGLQLPHFRIRHPIIIFTMILLPQKPLNLHVTI
ncbi:hypothetical protein BGZ60DRAFT_407029 [Tricladium varicosporioides]|nr:hypothetical protein BGZ60DRAFT_407029 [Hymenoscyphus varicosporioides]